MEPSMFATKLIRENGTIVGINLGFCFSSMHENGILTLERAFGFEGDVRLTIDPVVRATIKRVDEFLSCHSYNDGSVYLSRVLHWNFNAPDASFFLRERVDLCLNVRLRSTIKERYCDPGLSAAWSPSEFAICANGPGKEFLPVLYDAFLEKKVAIFNRPPRNFETGGLAMIATTLASPNFLKAYARS
jgi:hypothetical protein